MDGRELTGSNSCSIIRGVYTYIYVEDDEGCIEPIYTTNR